MKEKEILPHLVDHLITGLHIPPLLARCRRVWVLCTPRPDIKAIRTQKSRENVKKVQTDLITGPQRRWVSRRRAALCTSGLSGTISPSADPRITFIPTALASSGKSNFSQRASWTRGTTEQTLSTSKTHFTVSARPLNVQS